MAAKRVDGPGSGQDFAAMEHAPRNQVLLSGWHGDTLSLNDQRVAALDDDHILVVVVDMRGGGRGLTTGPERHLASVRAIEHVTLDSWGRLIGLRNPVCRMLHEFGEIVHSRELLSHSSRQAFISRGSTMIPCSEGNS